MLKKKNNLKYYESVGRRKSAIARVRLYIATGKKEIEIHGIKFTKGDFIVNGRPVNQYFPGVAAQKTYMKPLELVECKDRFAVSIKVKGGGIIGQLDAVVHGLSRALLLVDSEYRPALKKEGLLTRDPRSRERRKVGTGGKARRKKQSPKR